MALIPGSFDPITVGHEDVITRAAQLFDRVIVAVMTNDMTKYVATAKQKSYLFSMVERYAMVQAACRHLDNVQVVCSDGMLIDLFDEVGATLIVKGIRNEQDYAYEQKHAEWNRAHNPRAQTVYLPADSRYDHISSTLVRERIAAGVLPREAVSAAVMTVMCDILTQREQGGAPDGTGL